MVVATAGPCAATARPRPTDAAGILIAFPAALPVRALWARREEPHASRTGLSTAALAAAAAAVGLASSTRWERRCLGGVAKASRGLASSVLRRAAVPEVTARLRRTKGGKTEADIKAERIGALLAPVSRADLAKRRTEEEEEEDEDDYYQSGEDQVVRGVGQFIKKSRLEVLGQPEGPEVDIKDLPLLIPFLGQPKYRSVVMNTPGDYGFDPLGLAGKDRATFDFMSDSEIKHGRLAMLCAVGWPVSEWCNPQIAKSMGIPVMLAEGGRAPSFLNGGLSDITVGLVTFLIFTGIALAELGKPVNSGVGDWRFDPLDIYDLEPPAPIKNLIPGGRRWNFESEVLNGRIAMLVVTYFVYVEYQTKEPIIRFELDTYLEANGLESLSPPAVNLSFFPSLPSFM